MSRIDSIIQDAIKSIPNDLKEEINKDIRKARKKIELAIVAALPKEARAINEVLGGDWVYLPHGKRAAVTYIYHSFQSRLTGEVLHVVIALANNMGNNSAAVTAAALLSEFPSINDIIICGIAGGVPSLHSPDDHVRLGDVVVGISGVTQYDFVKRQLGGSELRKMSSTPSAGLTAAVSKIRMEESRMDAVWHAFIKESGVKRPGKDILRFFMDGGRDPKPVRHPKQKMRTRDLPMAHYGMIGSANILLKDEYERDRLGKEYKLKAIEMEGSGIADAAWTFQVGYIAVRSICDYCNSDKNDKWQWYAANVAAAYTRAIVEVRLATQPFRPGQLAST